MKFTDLELVELREKHNPEGLPVGHFTGRCGNCHSDDLWDDATFYGCNCCGSMFSTENVPPRVVNNLTGEVTSFNTWEEFDEFHKNQLP